MPKKTLRPRKPPPSGTTPADVEAFVASGSAKRKTAAPKETNKRKATGKRPGGGSKPSGGKPLGPGCQRRADGTIKKRRTIYLDPELDRALEVFATLSGEDVSDSIARAVSALVDAERPAVWALAK